MSFAAVKILPSSETLFRRDCEDTPVLAGDWRYVVRIAANAAEVAAALRLRHEVFNRELGIPSEHDDALEFDRFDLRCKHLIAIERSTNRVIGTYRVNTIGAAEGIDKFYSHDEFTLEAVPEPVLRNSMEIGRACVALEHRGSKALFLLWKGLARYLRAGGKRYIFGCCSIFTSESTVGEKAYRQLVAGGHLSSDLSVNPRRPIYERNHDGLDVPLPPLFEMYLKLGAKVCGPPTYDAVFGSVDFLVVLDLVQIDARYRRMFFR